MEFTAEEQLAAAQPISPPSDQSQYSLPTPTKEPQRFRFYPLKFFPNIRYYLNWKEFFKPEKSKIVLLVILLLPSLIRFSVTLVEQNLDVLNSLYEVMPGVIFSFFFLYISDPSHPWISFLLYYLLIIIILYPLSCLTIWIYRKNRTLPIIQNLIHADWKKFFKPSISKIVLFVILLIFVYILDYFLIFIGIANFGSSIKPDPTLTQRVFGAILEIILNLVSPLRFIFHFYGRYLFVLDIIYLYFLACFIVWIFNRVRRKKLNP